ncbi:hypothetical protein HBA55_11170 [Pseudomaricurvus alkylphenolicus]|uniref:hypothetical protein n=1 Tax=Pseudomaricurvus alkylphenolicus TaxID=1306991 RepID=UPI001421A95A|nr:hypothetical protein [Pseudomaricurvus alkylphenolicus]NIB40150.1 hypothetical protein [Pseudomaricurvus alkylphenolicus]
MSISSFVRRVFLSGFIAPLSIAEPFQSEVQLQYDDATANDLVDEGRALYLQARYFFAPVDARGAPRSEAIFVSRASGVSLIYGDRHSDVVRYFDQASTDTSTDAFLLSGTYTHAASGWYAAAGRLHREEVDLGVSEFDVEDYRVTVGKYLAGNTTLAFSLSRAEEDYRQGTETDGYGISFRHLGAWADYNYAVGLSYGRQKRDYPLHNAYSPRGIVLSRTHSD